MKVEELNELSAQVDQCLSKRDDLGRAQSELDERRELVDGLLTKLKDDQRDLDMDRRDNERRLQVIRQDLVRGRRDFVRDQKVAARDFTYRAKAVEDVLNEAIAKSDDSRK